MANLVAHWGRTRFERDRIQGLGTVRQLVQFDRPLRGDGCATCHVMLVAKELVDGRMRFSALLARSNGWIMRSASPLCGFESTDEVDNGFDKLVEMVGGLGED